MPRRSKIEALPKDVRKWLEDALIEGNFQQYQELEKLLEEKGHSIGKSILHRHGQKLQRRLDAIKASTDAARLIVDAAPDDEDNLSRSIISLVQSDLFNALLTVQEAADEDLEPAERLKLLSSAAKSIADISRASVGSKRFASEVRDKMRAELLREQEQKLDAAVQAKGMTAEQAAFWREQFLKGQ